MSEEITYLRIPHMPPADLPLSGAETFEAVQFGRTVRVSAKDLFRAGPPGPSAYEQAVAEGFEGNFTEWVRRELRGPKGEAGLDIYRMAVQELGYTGSLEDFITDLRGKDAEEFPEAPMDGATHGRRNGEWVDLHQGHGVLVSASDHYISHRRESAANESHTFVLPTAQQTFNLNAFAMRRFAQADLTSIFQTFSADTRDEFLASNGMLFEPTRIGIAGNSTTYTLTLDANDFKSKVIPVEDFGLAQQASYALPMLNSSEPLVDFEGVPAGTFDLTPSFAGVGADGLGPLGYEVSASSFHNASYFPSAAFDRSLATNNAWITANATWAPPQWLKIKLPMPARIIGYILANRNSPSTGSPRDWTIEGSNDDVNWTVLSRMTGYSNIARNGRYLELLPEPSNKYTFYRIHITAKNQTHIWAAIGELTFLTDQRPAYVGSTFLIESANGDVYTADPNSSGLLKLEEPAITEELLVGSLAMTDTGLLPVAQLKAIAPFKLVANYSPYTLEVNASFANTLAVARLKQTKQLADWVALKSLSVVTNLSAGGTLRMAVTRNGVDWFVWDGIGRWNSIGQLDMSTPEGQRSFANRAMPIAMLTSIGQEAWSRLFTDNGGVPDRLGLAFAFETLNPTDFAYLTSVNSVVELEPYWRKQTTAQVEIDWYSQQVVFKPVTAGEYIFAYQLPELPPPAPDLSINSVIVEPAEPQLGDTYTLIVTLANAGEIAAENSVVKLWIDGLESNIVPLMTDNDLVATFSDIPSGELGIHLLEVTATFDNAPSLVSVLEVETVPVPTAELSLASITSEPVSPEAGSSFDLLVTLDNANEVVPENLTFTLTVAGEVSTIVPDIVDLTAMFVNVPAPVEGDLAIEVLATADNANSVTSNLTVTVAPAPIPDAELSVTSLTPAPATPEAGSDFEVVVELANATATEPTNLVVSLSIDGVDTGIVPSIVDLVATFEGVNSGTAGDITLTATATADNAATATGSSVVTVQPASIPDPEPR